MPRLSVNGLVCAPGSGLGVVSVEGVTVAEGGGDANWFSSEDVAYVAHAEAQLRAYSTRSGQTRVLDSRGANWFRAKDHGWAAWLNGEIRTSSGWTMMGGYLAEVVNGRVIIADGSLMSLTSYSLTGHQLGETIPTDALGQDATSGLNVRVRDDLFLYQDRGGWHLSVLTAGGVQPLSIAPRLEDISYAVPVLVAGKPWLLERSYRLTLRPFDSTMGYEITTELCFGPDVVPAPGGGVWVTWSITQGEPPESLRVVQQSVGLPMIELNQPPVTDAGVTLPRIATPARARPPSVGVVPVVTVSRILQGRLVR